jgi:hypothetical protein
LFVSDKNGNGKKEDEPVATESNSAEPSTEAAAITMAKQAAKNAVEGKEVPGKNEGDVKKNANLELEASSDLESSANIADLEKKSSEMADAGLSRQNGLVEDKSQVIEEVSTGESKDDLAVPAWPKYQDPVGQRAEIEKEIKKVKKQAEDFKKSSEEADTELKKKNDKSGSEIEQKQKEIDLQHKSTVNKIKGDIYTDRLSFLQKMIKLADEGKQEEIASPSKAQALAQEEAEPKKKAAKNKGKKSGAKKDLLHRIDAQLTKLKGKNKEKEAEKTKDEVEEEPDNEKEEGAGDPNEASVDIDATVKADQALEKIDQSVRKGYGIHDRYMDVDGDEYAVNRDNVHRHLDGYRTYGGHDLDLYDIFRDFDRDGDGIVDDIDLDDPHWSESCKKNGYDPLEQYDDNAFRAGKYRGLSDEEWSQRESQHQHNLEELQKK